MSEDGVARSKRVDLEIGLTFGTIDFAGNGNVAKRMSESATELILSKNHFKNMAEQNLALMEAFKQCKSHLFNFASYKRDFLHYGNWLITNDLNSGLNEKVKGTVRGKSLFTKYLQNAFELANSENAEDLAKATAIFHEVLFLIVQKEKAKNDKELIKYAHIQTERAAEILSVYEKISIQVEQNDIDDLRELQQSRNIFLEKLPLEKDWMNRMFVNAYCEGLIYSCTVASGIEIELEEVIQLVRKYKRVNVADEFSIGQRKVHSLIKAYAFVFNSLDKKRKIDLEFVQQIHANAFEQNEKMLNDREKLGGKIVREAKRLDMLLAWMNLHFLRADYDPVTLAAIAHYGIFLLQPFMDGNHRTGRLIQDYILMSFGYPPACIFDEDIAKYLEKTEESRQYVGTDLRPFFRFISKCLSKTFEKGLIKFNPELIKTESPLNCPQQRKATECTDNNTVSAGWSTIFRNVLESINSELLHFE